MTKILYYTYLGDNGTVTTPVHLEGIYSIKKYKLIADKQKRLTKDQINFYESVMVPESEVSLWYEVSGQF